MAERSKFQQKAIKNFYDNREGIALQRAQELVTELYLTEGKARAKHWKSLATHLQALGIKPAKIEINGQKLNSVAINNERCMFCGNCYTMCPSMPLADKEGDGIVIMVGGKVSNRISNPKFSKVAVAFIPNEAPRWPQTTAVIKKIIDVYRETAYPVTGLWELFSSLIERSLVEGEEYTHKCLIFRKEEIVLPNGMSIRYPNLRQEKTADGGRSWVYGPDATKLYAGKITNNVVQGTARIVMTDGMLRIAKRYPVVGTVHDECIAVASDGEAQTAYEWMLEQMTLEPSYLPGIPLAADGGVHRRYGLAKQ